MFLFIFVFTSCVSLNRSQKDVVREMHRYSVDADDIKSPGLAGALNLLPGIGNFYLASGTQEKDQWIIGFLNFITWPLSPLWGIPQAAMDATAYNEKETADYFLYDPRGRTEWQGYKSRGYSREGRY